MDGVKLLLTKENAIAGTPVGCFFRVKNKKPSQASNLVEFLPEKKKEALTMAKVNVSKEELFCKLLGSFQGKAIMDPENWTTC